MSTNKVDCRPSYVTAIGRSFSVAAHFLSSQYLIQFVLFFFFVEYNSSYFTQVLEQQVRKR